MTPDAENQGPLNDITSMDIDPIIKGWDYKPGEVAARWITDQGGHSRIQMRVALGLLQMEPDGRPDGQRPNGFDSLLDYHEHRLTRHFQENKTTDGFSISPKESEELRQESYTYYLRYLCLFRLEEYERAVRDTARNLRVLDLMLHHTEQEEDRLSMEQYRPYIMMMNARAKASLALQDENRSLAAEVLAKTIEDIRNFYFQMEKEFEGLEGESLVESSEELVVLEEMLHGLEDESPESSIPDSFEEILHDEPVLDEEPRQLPTSVLDGLKEELKQAVDQEDFGKAASLRDRIQALEKVVNHRRPGGVHG